MKNQDIVVLTVLMKEGASNLSYQAIGNAAKISVSEAHASVKRLRECDLINSERNIKKRNVEEFMIHGLRYMFPMKTTGESIYGMPTAYAAPVSADAFAVYGDVPVWKNSNGNVLGRACEPIYPSAPVAAADDPDIYNKLAVVDMLRGGRLRERKFAEQKLKEFLA